MLFRRQAKEQFGVQSVTSADVDAFVQKCAQIYRGQPEWVDAAKHIKTVNFAQSVCGEIARLATMNIDITVDGSARAEWLNDEVQQSLMPLLRSWTEYGAALGTVIVKPNGESIDLVTPQSFEVTKVVNGKIRGIVFEDKRRDEERGLWFTRLEYHLLDGGVYTVQNRYYKSTSPSSAGDEVPVEVTPWVDAALQNDVTAEGVEDMLFGVFKMPGANNLDFASPLGLPAFASAVAELEDLDVAYSRNAKEILDSKRTVLLDSDRLTASAGKIASVGNRSALVEQAGLPDYVKLVDGTGQMGDEVYHEINPTLETQKRLEGVNALLSQIGFKCGFSNGYFVFNEKTGMVTATQVESDDRRTIQLITDVRRALRECVDGVLYALDVFADAYGLAPRGEYETTYDFADITLNEDEDKARWYSYVTNGNVPFWYYLTKFEGYSEDEAKALAAEAKEPEPLFGVTE